MFMYLQIQQVIILYFTTTIILSFRVCPENIGGVVESNSGDSFRKGVSCSLYLYTPTHTYTNSRWLSRGLCVDEAEDLLVQSYVG